MKNSRLTVVSICLFMLLGISLQAVQAKVNNVANYFEPLQNQWALLTVDFANAYKPSTARDKMIQEGVTADIAVDVSLLKLRESAETVQLLLSAGIHDKPLWASGLKPADSHVALPHLPRGAWWLLVKAMDHDGVVVQIKHLFLNVIESTIDTIPQWAGNENDTLAAWQSDNQLLVNVPSKTQSSLSLVFNKLDGTTLHQQRINLQNKSTKPLVVSLDWLSPGITAYVTLKSQQDEYRVWVGKKGHYPAIKPDLAMPGVKPVNFDGGASAHTRAVRCSHPCTVTAERDGNPALTALTIGEDNTAALQQKQFFIYKIKKKYAEICFLLICKV